jgi:short-subunit dehydrogenase
METAQELKAGGIEIIAQKIDVSIFDDMKKFADITFDRYGSVDYLFNCAGASTGGVVTEAYMKDFEWVFAVNTMALVYAAKTFVKRMIEQDKECHVINTLSIAAFMSLTTMQPYAASKTAGLAVSESLEWELREQGTKVRIHCLCPAFVATNFGDIEERRPPQYALDAEGIAFKQSKAQTKANYISKKFVLAGIPVEECVDTALKGVEEGLFIIHTHPQAVPFLKKWWNNLLDGRPGYTDNLPEMSLMIKAPK